MRKYAALALGLALAGCGGEAVDLGDNGEQPSFEGEWTGRLRSFLFVPDAQEQPVTRTVRLTLDAEGQGTLLVGDATLPPPTDPNVGYPPEAQADAAVGTSMLVHLYDGVAYSLESVRVTGNSLHVELDAVRAFEPFCALQTPVWTTLDDYRCRENTGGGRRDDENGEKHCYYHVDGDPTSLVEEDCLVLFMCRLSHTVRCVCTQSECTAGNDFGEPARVSFDLELDAAGTGLGGSYEFWDEDLQFDPQMPAQSVAFQRQ